MLSMATQSASVLIHCDLLAAQVESYHVILQALSAVSMAGTTQISYSPITPGCSSTWCHDCGGSCQRKWVHWLVYRTICHWSGIHTGALDPGQVQYTTAYDANIVAQAGHTVFTKSMNIDTRNKVIGQSNLNAKTGLPLLQPLTVAMSSVQKTS